MLLNQLKIFYAIPLLNEKRRTECINCTFNRACSLIWAMINNIKKRGERV